MTQSTSNKDSCPLFKGDLSKEDWIHMWDISELKFHQPTVYPDLVKYERYFKTNCRVLLPLCGKSLDLLYLESKGYDVHGCELVEKAAKSFFEENSISYSKSKVEKANIFIYKGKDKKITIYQGDFLSLSASVVGKFDAVWDRAAFVAINILQRQTYAEVLYDVMNPNCKYLLNTFVLLGKDYTGPPHTVTKEDIQTIFGTFCNIEHIETTLANPSNFFISNADSMYITNSLLTRKA